MIGPDPMIKMDWIELSLGMFREDLGEIKKRNDTYHPFFILVVNCAKLSYRGGRTAFRFLLHS